MDQTSVLKLDHVVMACANLQEGALWLEDKLGVPLAAGGQHDGFGTHNRLLKLSGGTYLELIAPDPSQAPPKRPRPFGLDHYCPALPQLIHHVVSTRDIDATLPRLPYQPAPAIPMQRGTLKWKIAVAANADAGGDAVLPTVIQWPEGVHPCQQLPAQGIALESMLLCLPAPILSAMHPLLGDSRITWRASEKAWMGIALQTPRGPQFFNSPKA